MKDVAQALEHIAYVNALQLLYQMEVDRAAPDRSARVDAMITETASALNAIAAVLNGLIDEPDDDEDRSPASTTEPS